MVEFKLFNIPVRVEPVFWLTIGLLAVLNFGIQTEAAILSSCLFVIAGFLSILIHEMGHALAIRYYRLPTQVVLSSFGGYAQYPAGYLGRKQSFIVTAAGPLAQVTIAGVVYFALPHLSIPENFFRFFLGIYILISFFWAALNCLPILPLDGGQMLAAILGPRHQSKTYLIGACTAMLIGCYAFVIGQPFLAIFMGMFAFQNYQSFQKNK